MSLKDEKSIGADVEVNNIVDFDGEDDPTNPLNWPKKLKWFLVILVSLLTTIITLATLICTPAVPQILAAFHSSNSYDSVILVSVWELGEIFGPFIVAPLSELYGKLPVWHVANTFFIIFSIATALSSNLNMVIAFRFLNGMASPYVLGSAIIGDLFAAEERGTGMSIATLMPIIGPSIGPIIGGYISKALGWRWAFWFVAIATGVVEGLLILFMRETYVVKILETKTRRLRKETGNQALTSKYDTGIPAKQLLLQTFLRPMKILVLSPIVTLLSLYLAVVYGYLYIILTTITEVLENTYHFSETSAGLAFLGIGLGLAAGAILCKFTLDRFVKIQAAKGKAKPEVRLKVMILGGLVLPAGLFIYGWTTEFGVQWIVPILSTALIGFGSMITLIPTQTYLVDAFTLHAASAIAAGGIFRSITGAVLPLAGPPLYKALGLGWGNSLLGFIALAIIPVPVLFCRYGEYLRERFPLNL